MTQTVDLPPAHVAGERSRILTKIGDQTLVDLLRQVCEGHGDSPAYSDRHRVPQGQTWRTLTWHETRKMALAAAAGMAHRGVRAGDTVAIMVSNRIEHMVSDMAALHAGAVPMSIYATLAADQVEYVAGQSQPSLLIVESADHLARWSTALEADSVHTVVVLDADALPDDPRYLSWEHLLALGEQHHAELADELAARVAALTGHSPATILYTSGTTGKPKGVVLSHQNVMYEAVATVTDAGLEDPQRQISYLPLAHIAERVLGLYGAQLNGGHVHCIGDPSELLATLGEVHPTAFFGVPRVWEKIKTGIGAKLASDPDPAARQLVTDSMAAGLAWVKAQETGGVMTPEIEAAYRAADDAILGFLKLLLGLDQATWCASAAAPMPLDVAEFMAGLGLKVYDVYGMTETCGAVTVNGPHGFRLGTVGRAIGGMEVKVAHDGEVLIRGPVVMDGYHRNPEATAGLIDADGWVHTGDIGTKDEDGSVRIIDRKKELIITSNGKNVAPSNVENLLKESPMVGHAMVVGDGRPYVVAILTLDGEIAPALATAQGWEFTDLADLAKRPEMHALVEAAVASANARLSRPEQVKKWTLLTNEWTAESSELTPTLKLKRRIVKTNYAAEIEAMYAE